MATWEGVGMDSRDVLTSSSGSSDDEKRLRLVIEATPNAMVMVDVDGRVVLVNSQTESLFGYDRAELLSMRVEELIPDRFRPRHEGYRTEFFAAPDTRTMGAGRDLFGLRKDGTEVPIEIGLNPLETDDGAFVLASIIDITERKRSEERLLHVVEAAPNAMIMVNEDGQIVLVNSQTERSFGYDREELLTMRVEDLLPDRFRPKHEGFRNGFFSKPDRREMGVGRELFGRRKDGTEIPIEIGLNPIQIMTENFVLASIIDITERLVVQAAQNALREDLLRRSILDSLPFSIIATDAVGTIVTANPAAEKLLGYRQQELVGSPITSIQGELDSDDAADRSLTDLDTPPGDNEREWVYQRKDGSRIPVNEANAAMYADNGEASGFLTVAYDITKRIEAQAFVKHMAHHDFLTDLPNRTRLFDHLVAAIGQAESASPTGRIVILLMDLDHFKRVNDSLGHHVGDELLLCMSARLTECVREEDLVARLAVTSSSSSSPTWKTRMPWPLASRGSSRQSPPRSTSTATSSSSPRAWVGRRTRSTAPTLPACSRTPTPRCTTRRRRGGTTSSGSSSRCSTRRTTRSRSRRRFVTPCRSMSCRSHTSRWSRSKRAR